jgi:hypothetical protein
MPSKPSQKPAHLILNVPTNPAADADASVEFSLATLSKDSPAMMRARSFVLLFQSKPL